MSKSSTLRTADIDDLSTLAQRDLLETGRSHKELSHSSDVITKIGGLRLDAEREVQEGEPRDLTQSFFRELPTPDYFDRAKIRKMSREAAKKFSKKAVEQLREEYRVLALKKSRTGLSQKEERRFALVGWQLDNIEDAESGEELDRLETIVVGYERFSKDIEKVMRELTSVQLGTRKK